MREDGTARIVVIDAQGGGLGRQVILALRSRFREAEITAVGSNSAATAAMLKAGAQRAATGENAVVVASREADVIIGPVGIVMADAMLGEITEAMAAAVSRSRARLFLLPIGSSNCVTGTEDMSLSRILDALLRELSRELPLSGRTAPPAPEGA